MRPASTSWAPVHNTHTTLANTRKITAAVSSARALVDSRAAWNARSTSAAKRRLSVSSPVKAWIVRAAPIASVATAEASARVSWARRERPRTVRPKATSGSTTNGIASSTRPASRGLVTTMSTIEPMTSTMLRSAIEADAPTADLICVVSAVSRDTSSPVRA